MKKKPVFFVIIIVFSVYGCKSQEAFTGFSYDPPDVTNTKDKEIKPQPKRVIGSGNPKVWFSNEFTGARLNDVIPVNDSTFNLIIEPENEPINNSPWFGFKVWAEDSQTVKIYLTYKHGSHRYIPKEIIKNKAQPISFIDDTANGRAILELKVTSDTTTIAAQHILTTLDLQKRLQKFTSTKSFVHVDTAGFTKEKRPILALNIDKTYDNNDIKPVLILLGRQHPPEVSGYRTQWFFIETLLSESNLANEFLNTFRVMAFPMMNPDGVDNGHWRHNTGGIDLNRDWVNFNQPETKAVRDYLIPLMEMSDNRPYYAIDFHSTDEHIFYPILKEVPTNPDNISQDWITEIINKNPDIPFRTEEFDTSSPIAKNWFFRNFGIDALTYEVYDELSEDQIKTLGESSANSLMKILLERWNSHLE